MPFSISYYRTHSPEFKGLKLEIIFFYLLFHFSWIQIRNNKSGSRSRVKFRIHSDPDPQRWLDPYLYCRNYSMSSGLVL